MWLDYIHGFQLFSVAPFMFSKHILQKKKKKRDVKGAYMTVSRSRAAVSVLGGGPVLRTCSETGAELSVFGNLSVSFKMTWYP